MHQVRERPLATNPGTPLDIGCTTAISSPTGPAPRLGAHADCFELPSGELAFCVWEALSRDGAVAPSMLLVRAGLHALLVREPDIESTAIALNRVLFMQAKRAKNDHVVSGIFGIVDRLRKRLRFVSCGHHTALLFEPTGDHEHLSRDGTSLGAHETGTFPMHEIAFDRGNLLVIVTSGIAETCKATPLAEPFGSRRISSLFAAPSSFRGQDAGAVVGAALRFSGRPLARDSAALVARAT